MAEGLRIEGLTELQQRLTTLKQSTADRILNRALQAGAAVFQQHEADRAPERPDLPSGTALPPGVLRRDVAVRRLRGVKNVWIIGPGRYTRRAAHLVEFGHRLVRGGKNRQRAYGLQSGPGLVVGQVPPHPYVRPAFEAAQQEALDVIAESLQADLARLDYRTTQKGGA